MRLALCCFVLLLGLRSAAVEPSVRPGDAETAEDLSALGRCVESLRASERRYRSRVPSLVFVRDRRLYQLVERVRLSEANFNTLSAYAGGDGPKWLGAVVGNALESCLAERERLEAHGEALWRFLLSLTLLGVVWLTGLVMVALYGRPEGRAAVVPRDRDQKRSEV